MTPSQIHFLGPRQAESDTPANEAPTIISDGGEDTAPLFVAENATAVTTVVASDPDAGDTLTYSISGGADALLFAMDEDSGALTFVDTPNFEAPADANGDNVYNVSVAVTDGISTDSQSLAVTVTNAPGVIINGTNGANTVNASTTVAGQPLPTDEEDTILGNGGADSLSGLGGDDIIRGGNGGDTLNGGLGKDHLFGDGGADTLNGDEGDDYLDGGANSDALNGGDGTDTAIFAGNAVQATFGLSGANVTVQSTGGGTDALSAIEKLAFADGTYNLVAGAAGADGTSVSPLTGTSDADVLLGFGGNDFLMGGGGNDLIDGGLGGADAAIFSAFVLDAAFGLNGNNLTVATVDDGADTLRGVERLIFDEGTFNLVLGSNAGNGGLTGGANADVILGFNGGDTLTGNNGADVLIGGRGGDILNGGAGDDIFVYKDLGDSLAGSGMDRIANVESGDKFQIGHAIDGVTTQFSTVTSSATGSLVSRLGAALATLPSFAAGDAALVTFTRGGSYLVINDGTAGFQAGADAVVLISERRGEYQRFKLCRVIDCNSVCGKFLILEASARSWGVDDVEVQGPQGRLGDCFAVVVIVLLSFHERLDVDCRDDPPFMSERPQRPIDKMRAEAGLRADDAGRLFLERSAKRQPLYLTTERDFPISIKADDMKSTLSDVDPNRCHDESGVLCACIYRLLLPLPFGCQSLQATARGEVAGPSG